MMGLWMGLGTTLLGQVEPTHRRVLLIHSFARDFAPFSSVAHRFRSELTRQNQQPVEFFEASLQTIQPGETAQVEALVAFLAATFRDSPPDLVVPMGAPAAIFYQTHRDRLFPGVPMLVAGADQRRLKEMTASEGIVKASLELDLPGLLEDVLAVRPETRRIYFATGITPLERFWETEVLRTWREKRGDLEYISLSDQSVEQMQETVMTLPPDSALFVDALDRDAAGVPHEGNTPLVRLSRVSNAPVFGFSVEQMGLGIVGGRLMDMEKCGERAAGAAVKLLSGTPPTEIEIDRVVPESPVYDARELKRWGIPAKVLPPGSEIRYREATLWETHQKAVLIAGGMIGLQMLLIFLLLAARRRAREIGANLNLTVDAANVGLWSVDLGERTVNATPKWRQLFGFPPKGPIDLEEVIARIHIDDRAPLRQAIEQSARQGKSYMVEHRLLLPTGEERWVKSLGRSDEANGGGHLRNRGVSIDISARKKTELEISRQREELSHLSRVGTLGVISGALAHELNQPLGSILSNAQAALWMMARENLNLVELREILSDIVGEDKRAGEVINRWRSLLRRGEMVCEPVDVLFCVNEVLRLLRNDLAAGNISVQWKDAAGVPKVMGDPIQLQQVFLNLIVNARDAMATVATDRKKIEIRVWRDGDVVRVEMRDQGVGLPENTEQIFEPFHSTKEQGLGMGLAICQAIVVHHGGRLWAENAPEGGAAIQLSLPVGLDTE